MKLFSPVESHFISRQDSEHQNSRIPYVVVDNFPQLGLITALRFLEWVHDNPHGVISLPTGKTPEFFIRWTQYLLRNWNNKKGEKLLNEYGLHLPSKPNLSNLQFVQIDEFYPINPTQKNSFYNYVNEFYIKGFGLDSANAMLINANEILLYNNKTYEEIFPDLKVDLSLRYREAKTNRERCQKDSIFKIDEWCARYEEKIRQKGGIGFFLGGIGPDGHIAFNIKGSDHFSTTRLIKTNFETQAVAAGDLGGIDISKNRLVITISLHTITYNPEAVAIIFGAGEAKAEVVKNALENEPTNQYPGSVLQKLKNNRQLTPPLSLALSRGEKK